MRVIPQRYLGRTVLIHGQAGVGKRTLAQEIGRQLNCEGCTDGSCASCRLVSAGNHPDILLLEPAEKGGIGVEQVHELHHQLLFQQYDSSARRVAIIARLDSASIPAQNALLKLLEEPPPGTTIILTTESVAALLPTVVSRAQQLYLGPRTAAQVQALLRDLGTESELARDVALVSGGSIGLALQLAEDPVLLQDEQERRERATKLYESADLFTNLRLTTEIATSKNLPTELVSLEAVAREYVRLQPVPKPLAAVERLRTRLKSNVTPKYALDVFAMELL